MCCHAVERALSFLCARQDDDGHWRDYQLKPGRSEAWTTACAGFAVLRAGGRCGAVDRAAAALLRTQRPGGWGYNSRTACDADTTSWAIRFLSAMNSVDRPAAAAILRAYIRPSGRVGTFPSPGPFGSWAEEHDEVAPLAGLALLACGDAAGAGRVRGAALAAREWRPFWWRCPSYALAWNIEFLAESGGLPESVRLTEAQALAGFPPATSAFDMAHRCMAEARLGGCPTRAELLEAQQDDGGWPPSYELRVPSQSDGAGGEPQADDRRLMSTTMAILAMVNPR